VDAEHNETSALKQAAARAMASGDLRGARALLEEAASRPDPDVDLWMSLAACRRGLGDLDGASTAVERALALQPRHFIGLLMRASLLERRGERRAAAVAYGNALTQAPRQDALDPMTLRALDHARDEHARYLAELDAMLKRELGLAGGPDAARATVFIERISGKRRAFHQEPAQFHYPGLPEEEFHSRDAFPWLAELEAATDAIRAEAEAVLAVQDDELTPYVRYADGIPLDQWAELNRSRRWSAYHLWLGGEVVADHARSCPRTMAAIGRLPQPRIPGRLPSAMFSHLAPHTRIPPHTGVANFRLVVHLGLILPPGCGFRVGSETREWRRGEAWVFDDTIEHEAWNDSDSPRTILICDVWNPRLSAAEQELIAAIVAGMDDFNGFTPAGEDG
jgi:aspartyl/asparaginyl beta-hydroxylase (cupin superfamily)